MMNWEGVFVVRKKNMVIQFGPSVSEVGEIEKWDY